MLTHSLTLLTFFPTFCPMLSHHTKCLLLQAESMNAISILEKFILLRLSMKVVFFLSVRSHEWNRVPLTKACFYFQIHLSNDTQSKLQVYGLDIPDGYELAYKRLQSAGFNCSRYKYIYIYIFTDSHNQIMGLFIYLFQMNTREAKYQQRIGKSG